MDAKTIHQNFALTDFFLEKIYFIQGWLRVYIVFTILPIWVTEKVPIYVNICKVLSKHRSLF